MAGSVEDTAISKGEAVPLRFRQWYLPDRDKAQVWKERAKICFDFVCNRQWSEDEIKIMNRPGRKRPVITFNRIGPIVDAITGYEIGNRREVRYIPRELGDVKANELLTGAGQWFRDEGFGDYADSAMFACVVIGGMGWTETRLNFDDGPTPEPIIEELDPFEMAWDRDSRQRNLRDARRVWRTRRIPFKEAQSMFPGFDRNELHAGWSEVSSEADLMRGNEPTHEGDNGYVTIVQCQWVEKEAYWVAEDPLTGQEAEFTSDEYAQANKRLKAMLGMEMQGVKFKRKVRKQAFFGEVVLSYGPAPCNDEFSLQCTTGKFDRNEGIWYGAVEAMLDPQRWANKWLAQMMHIMNSNAKGGIMAEAGAFKDPRTAQKEWSQPDSVTMMEDGALSGNKVKEKPQTQFPVGFQQLTEFAISSIRDVSGVSLELLGQRESDQAASLEYQRRQSGMTILQPLFDGLKLYREMQGRVVLYYLQNDVPEGTLVRIAGKDNEQYVPLMREANKTFDIIVDDAPNAPNQKEQIWGIVQGMMPLVGKVIPPEYILKALKYSPLPSSVVSELEEMAKAPNPEAQQAAADRAKMAAAEIDKTNSEAMLNAAKAQAEGQKGQTEQIKAQAAQEEAQMDMQVSRAEFAQTMQQMAMERERDREKHVADMEKIAAQVMATNAKVSAQRQAVTAQ